MNFPLYHYQAKIERWIDGDTVDMTVDLGFRMSSTTRFRLYGVDTPERGQPNYAEARLFASNCAPIGDVVAIETFKDPDKYGRWLVNITCPHSGHTINDELITAGLAVPYFGGTK